MSNGTLDVRTPAATLLVAPLVAAAVLAVAPKSFAAEARPVETFAALDELVPQELERWNVPGLAIAVVHNGTVAYLRGFGVADLERATPVTPRTAFPIASVTKAFTTTLIAQQVAAGRLAWDEPVERVLPGLRLPTRLAGRLTLRDAVAHRAGLATYAGDLLWWNSNATREQILARLHALESSGDFRASYAYCNVLYAVAAAALEQATGGSWAANLTARVLEPLGMRATHPSAQAAHAAGAPLAKGYTERAGRLLEVEPTVMTAADAAGAMVSTAEDIARWLQVQLDGGAPLLARDAHAALLQPQILVPADAEERRRMPETVLRAAALGWFVRDFRGRELLQHGGALDGAFGHVSFMPSTRTGVAVFTNRDHHSLAVALNYLVHDLVLGVPDGDWSARLWRVAQEKGAPAGEGDLPDPSADGSRVHPDEVAGAYVDPYYGEASLAAENGRLVLRLSAHPRHFAEVRPWRGNVARVTWNDPVWRESILHFDQARDGRIAALRLRVRPDWIDTREYRFVRREAVK